MNKQLRKVIERVVLNVIKKKGWDGIYFIQNQSVKFLKSVEKELEKEKYEELGGGDYTTKEITLHSVECFDRVMEKYQYGDEGFNPKELLTLNWKVECKWIMY